MIGAMLTLFKDGDVSRRVNLLKSHLQLIEEPKSDAPLLLHNAIDHLRIEFDVQCAQGRLQLREVVNLGCHVLPSSQVSR